MAGRRKRAWTVNEYITEITLRERAWHEDQANGDVLSPMELMDAAYECEHGYVPGAPGPDCARAGCWNSLLRQGRVSDLGKQGGSKGGSE